MQYSYILLPAPVGHNENASGDASSIKVTSNVHTVFGTYCIPHGNTAAIVVDVIHADDLNILFKLGLLSFSSYTI